MTKKATGHGRVKHIRIQILQKVMRIELSYHAYRRMRRRKIHLEWVKETIRWPHSTRKIGHKYYVTRKINGHTLRVVYVKEKHLKVVTLYFK